MTRVLCVYRSAIVRFVSTVCFEMDTLVCYVDDNNSFRGSQKQKKEHPSLRYIRIKLRAEFMY